MTAESIVIQIAKAPGGRILVDLHSAPQMAPGETGFQDLNCDPATLPAWTDANGVRLRGEKVLTALLTAHNEVKTALDAELAKAAGNSCRIKFWLKNVGSGEQICWETLWRDKPKFLALNKRWPIGRIAGVRKPAPVDLSRAPIDQDHPLRVLAILSAAGVKAKGQWDGFYKAVKEMRQPDFPIRITVMTGERALSDAIVALNDPEVSVKAIQSRTIALEQEFEQVSPHLIHFFCHGLVSHDTPRLQIATFASYDDPEERPISLTVEDLANMPSVRNAWLVTLNCCEGAAANKQIASLTYTLVAQGATAAVGMTEPLEVLDSNEFCRYFYPEVFRIVKAAVDDAKAGNTAALEWPDALYAPRTALRDRHEGAPEDQRQWTLPVLYTQLWPVELHSPAAQAAPLAPAKPAEAEEARRAREETVAGLLRALPPEQAELIRQELLKIQAEDDR